MNRLLGALARIWFEDGSATRLALIRIAIGLGTLCYLGPRFTYFSEVAASSPALFEPVGLARLLDEPISVRLFQVMFVMTILANVAFVFGWRFGRTGPLFAALFLWLLCYRNSWSAISHTDDLVLWHILVLALTRSADALSLDASLRGRSLVHLAGIAGRRPTAPVAAAPMRPLLPPRHWEYGYPVKLMCSITAVVYLLSGVAQLAGPLGWGWSLGEGLRTQIALDVLHKDLLADGAGPLEIWFANNEALALVLGAGTLALELGAPVALLSGRLGVVWALAAFAMHWGILAIVGVVCWYQLSGVAFLSFVVTDRMVARLMSDGPLPRAT